MQRHFSATECLILMLGYRIKNLLDKLAISNYNVNIVNVYDVNISLGGKQMDTKDKILEVAKKEFIKRGFEDASMRSIASQVGISATALYRHYSNKEEIFEAVVGPVVEKWNRFCETERIRQTSTAWDHGLEAMWEDDRQLGMIVDMIYEDIDEQRLLFCGSEGTKYENFLHDLVTKVQKYTLLFMSGLEKSGVHVEHVDGKEMHLLLTSEYSCILEMLKHDFSYDEARHYAYTVAMFFTEGWRKFLGF